MRDVQILGHGKSRATRAAQRFFSERRVPVHFADVRKRRPAPGELRKWVERFGVEAVVDTESKAYRDQGLAYLSASDDQWLDRLAEDPALIRLPLVRCGTDLTVGEDAGGWQRLADAARQE